MAKNQINIIINNNKIYRTGDEILGTVELTLAEKLKRSDIKINLVCLAEVEWDVDVVVPQYYAIDQPVHDKKTYLNLDNAIIEPDRILTPGNHVIDFKFQLPSSGIPSTFNSFKGSINYFVQAQINKDEMFKFEIDVAAPLTENLHLSVTGSTYKVLDLINLATGNLRFAANISKRGFAAGESIELQTHVENNCTLEVTPRATLYKTVIYLTNKLNDAETEAVTQSVKGVKIENQGYNKQTLNIPIPNDVSLSIKTSIINVKYFIHVTLDIPHAIDLHINLPIVITANVE